MKKYIVLFLAWAAISPPAWADAKIRVVDMEKLMKTLPRAVKINAEIETEFKNKKKELEKSEDDLRTMEKDLEKKKAVLSEKVLKQKQQTFQAKILEFREHVTKSQMELQKKQMDLLTPVHEEIKKAVAELATSKGYELIINQDSSLMYVGKAIDITDELVQSMKH